MGRLINKLFFNKNKYNLYISRLHAGEIAEKVYLKMELYQAI